MHLKKRPRIPLLILLVSLWLFTAGHYNAEAAGTISVYGNDTPPGNNVDLGLIIVEVPPGALHSGDTFSLSLPVGFSFNTAIPAAVGSDIGTLTASTVNVVYPSSISGKVNAITTGNLTASYSGSRTFNVALTGNPSPTNTAILYVYLKGVSIPSDFKGDVKISITGNSGWPTTNNNDSIADSSKNDPKPPEQKGKPATPIKAQFKIGENFFSLNGTQISMEAAPFLKNGRTYVPVRYVVRAAGIPDENISFENGVVSIKSEKITAVLTPGSNTILLGGKSLQMDAPVLTMDGRTFVPLRWVCEAFNLRVMWDEKEQAIIIES